MNEERAVEAELAGQPDLAVFYRARNAERQPSHCEYVASLEQLVEDLLSERLQLREQLAARGLVVVR